MNERGTKHGSGHDPGVESASACMTRFQSSWDTQAFQQLVSDHTGAALGVARRILSDDVLAEDAVQEAFLRVVRFRHQYDRAKPFSVWFYTILRNVCRDILRQRVRHMQAMNRIAESLVTPTQHPAGKLEVQDFLQKLPASEQSVLVLRILHDMSFPDISAVMGISVEAAKKRAQRGLRALRQNLQAMDATRSRTEINATADAK